jgi:hypothetical protein
MKCRADGTPLEQDWNDAYWSDWRDNWSDDAQKTYWTDHFGDPDATKPSFAWPSLETFGIANLDNSGRLSLIHPHYSYTKEGDDSVLTPTLYASTDGGLAALFGLDDNPQQIPRYPHGHSA